MLVVAPATANIIGKMANGIGDDALSTLLLSFRKPLFVCPAMNTQMMESAALQRNIETLRRDGAIILDSPAGELACGTTGAGRMPEPEEIMQALSTAAPEPDLSGQKVLVTAGPTYERIDSVRFIGNYSSGKMGFALSQVLAAHGAQVELIAGPTSLKISHHKIHRTDIESAREMYEAAVAAFPSCQAAILSAAVADYRPDHAADHKLKKQGAEGMTLTLVQNPDILATLGTMKTAGQTLIGFALETDNELDNARRKLEKKNLDYIVLTSLGDAGAGFGVDTTRVTIIGRDGSAHATPLLSKTEVAEEIVKCCLGRKA
jgi:phosphopantothenoylcysteine decarboxylase/phosphopantothenate--cysteine ligase